MGKYTSENLVNMECMEAMRFEGNEAFYDEFHYWNTLLSFYGLDAIPTYRKEVG